ncbi:autotransporter outer membrane beta-barrel domain-containing protein [Campylobacter pinnipediorum]|uniref:autotransporter outer membrane beta-barrel domain-containing protein n=1 Tax=Campylobacter pinnipediorum TaxID=1965231 RepID=UPI0009958D5A|nr:autotransporter outer membrane beta-barrel domain-containing protein [Campylobacter pinnipediorum]AQW82075.1 autotransporter domain protein [Campylobacter pinnipediorum subsp. pinnipediorum]
MKISKIASATIIGAIMTINVYGSSSLDEINSAQKEKSDFIKKLEEASKDGFLEKFKKEKDEIEQQKRQAEEIQKQAEQAKEQAEQAKEQAEQRKTATETAKNEAEKLKNEILKEQTATKEKKDQAEQEKQQAKNAKTAVETRVEEFFKKNTIKSLNDEIKKIETDHILKDLIKQTTKDDTKGIGANEIKYIKDEIVDKKLEELSQDINGEKNHNKILILSYLKNIGILKTEIYNKYNHDFQDEDSETAGSQELSKQRMKKLAEKFKEIIGDDKTKGLRKLYAIINQIDNNKLAEEFKKLSDAQKELKNKEQELKNKEQELKVKEQEFEKQQQIIKEKEQEVKEKEKIIGDQQKIAEQAQQELDKAQQELEQAKKQAEQKLKELQPKLDKVQQELEKAEELAKLAKNPEVKAKIIAELESKLNQAKKERAEAISSDKNLELNKDEAQTVLSLLSVTNNEEVNNLLLKTEAEDIAILAKNINSSLEEVAQEFKNNQAVDTLLSSVGSAINSRLAKLSNPLNDDLALAYAIKNLSDNKFADNGDTLSSVVKEYTNRFNYDSNLWGNIMGGKAKLKSQANTNTYGFMLGYDKAFDNMIIGGYAGYTNARSSSDALTTKSDNYHFGAYTRMYIEQNEIDAKVSYGKGKNKLDRKVAIDSDFDANAKYNSKFFNTSIDYGYIFDINNNSFMKPMIGLEYSHINTKGFKETGKVPVSFKGSTIKTLSAKAAVEFRTYIANGNFLYITPGIQRELTKSMKDTQLAFVNSTENIKYASKKDKNTFFTLKTGAEMKLTDNLSTNVNFGVKAKSKQQHYNGTIGLSYKF